jgi:DNA polymerase III subunit delta
MQATQFLKNPAQTPIESVVVLFGSERFLRQSCLSAVVRQVLGGEEGDDIGLTRFEGKDPDLKSVLDELLTISMWGDKRLVLVDDADDFVTKHRVGLEKALQKPQKKSVLMLVVEKWPKTTRLYKLVEKIGLNLSCEPLKDGEIPRWLIDTAREQFQKDLDRPAASLMLELAGSGLGLLEQELSKLASYVGDRQRITTKDVTQLVGGWRAETTWAMVDAIIAGQVGQALNCLDKLLAAREAPLMILGGLAFKFRQLSQATEISRQGTKLPAALQSAGVWRNNIQSAEKYLRRVGRSRAESIAGQILDAREFLGGGKGSLSQEQQRIILETLLIRLGA